MVEREGMVVLLKHNNHKMRVLLVDKQEQSEQVDFVKYIT
jgi:hypothetical protein